MIVDNCTLWQMMMMIIIITAIKTHLLKTPPRREAFKHSGGARRRCTSATVTLYLLVLLRRLNLPGTEQKTSLGDCIPMLLVSLPVFMAKEIEKREHKVAV